MLQGFPYRPKKQMQMVFMGTKNKPMAPWAKGFSVRSFSSKFAVLKYKIL
jgi:hypothetical protein